MVVRFGLEDAERRVDGGQHRCGFAEGRGKVGIALGGAWARLREDVTERPDAEPAACQSPRQVIEGDAGIEHSPDGRRHHLIARVERPVGERFDRTNLDEAVDDLHRRARLLRERLGRQRPHESTGPGFFRGARSSWPARSGHS